MFDQVEILCPGWQTLVAPVKETAVIAECLQYIVNGGAIILNIAITYSRSLRSVTHSPDGTSTDTTVIALPEGTL